MRSRGIISIVTMGESATNHCGWNTGDGWCCRQNHIGARHQTPQFITWEAPDSCSYPSSRYDTLRGRAQSLEIKQIIDNFPFYSLSFKRPLSSSYQKLQFIRFDTTRLQFIF
jgi:hypothetical protein